MLCISGFNFRPRDIILTVALFTFLIKWYSRLVYQIEPMSWSERSFLDGTNMYSGLSKNRTDKRSFPDLLIYPGFGLRFESLSMFTCNEESIKNSAKGAMIVII